MTIIGEKLKALRGDRSLREIERNSGVSHTFLSNIEKGVDPRSGKELIPTPEILKKLARVYNYPYGDLMEIAGYFDVLSNDDKEKVKNRLDRHQSLDEEIFKKLNQMISDKEEFINEYRSNFMKIIEDTKLDTNIDFNSKEALDIIYQAICDFNSTEWKMKTLDELERMILNYKEKTDLNTILERPNLVFKEISINQNDKQLIKSYLEALFSNR